MGRGFEKRKKIIMDCLQRTQEMRVTDLIDLTGAAVATVRRDLLELEKQKCHTHWQVHFSEQKTL